MKRLLTISAFCLMTFGPVLWAIPTEINYQGTLKKNGLPDIFPETVTFQLTSQDGNTVYSQPINISVTPINGLFSAKLDFQLLTGFTWESITPYIKVSVGGQALSPAEKVSATIYAVISGSVAVNGVSTNSIADGSVTNSKLGSGAVTNDKLDPSVQGITIPSGMIAMFATGCPLGWTRFSALDNAFPMGGAIYGATGGSATHSHTISIDGAHSHTTQTTCNMDKCSVPFGSSNAEYNPASSGWVPQTPSLTTSVAGGHDHGGSTGVSSNLPPYLSVVFCQKN